MGHWKEMRYLIVMSLAMMLLAFQCLSDKVDASKVHKHHKSEPREEYVDPVTSKHYVIEKHEQDPSALETKVSTEKKGILGSIGKAVGGAAKALSGLSKTSMLLPGMGYDSPTAKIEDCTACKYVWGRVEMEIANTRFPADIQASFERQCMDAQRTRIFYKPCETMFDDLYAFVDDYLSGKYDVTDMCARGKMCR